MENEHLQMHRKLRGRERVTVELKRINICKFIESGRGREIHRQS
jgi:hypothetical protein